MNASHWKLPNGTKRSREFPEQLKLVANYTRTTREREATKGERGEYGDREGEVVLAAAHCSNSRGERRRRQTHGTHGRLGPRCR